MKAMDASDLICPHHGIHLWLPSAARKLRFRGYDDEETVMALVQLTRGARRLVPEREIRSGVKLVFGTEPGMITAHAPKIRYESDKLERFASQASAVDEYFFQARSKYTCRIAVHWALWPSFSSQAKSSSFSIATKARANCSGRFLL